MKSIFTLLGLFCFGFCFGETIQQVEYNLPKAAQNWEIGNKIDNERGSTIIYIPQEADRKNVREFFGVNANNRSFNPNDPDSIKQGLSKMFPNLNFEFQVLDKTNDSVTYEWSVKDDSGEKVHGLGRVFSTKEGTVVLGYQTETVSNLPQARPIWLQALKEAKQ